MHCCWPLFRLYAHSAPENVANLATPAKKLEHVIRLAELVIEVLQQNQDHHAEVSNSNNLLLFVIIAV